MSGVVRFNHGGHRAEQFVAERRHARLYVSNHGGLIKVSLMRTTGQQPRSGSDGCLNLAVNQSALGSADQWANYRVRIAGITHLQRLHFRNQSFEEGVVDGRLNDDARARHADLPLMNEDAKASG